MKIDITIQGVTALLCNRFCDEAAERATNGATVITNGGNRGTPREQAEKKLYLNADDQPTIPQPNLLRCLIDGGRYFKAGKKQITTKNESLLYACLDIEGAEIPIEHREAWRVDTRPVRIPSTGGRILTHRPIFDDWELSFTVDLDNDMIDVRLLRDIVDASGKRIGLGDFRPATKGPFGKFVVTKFVVTKWK